MMMNTESDSSMVDSPGTTEPESLGHRLSDLKTQLQEVVCHAEHCAMRLEGPSPNKTEPDTAKIEGVPSLHQAVVECSMRVSRLDNLLRRMIAGLG